jgi:hypothetical protein
MLKISPDAIARGKVFANKKGQTRLVIGWVECEEEAYLEYLDHRSKAVISQFATFCRWADHEVPDYQHQSELGRCPCCSSLFTEWHFAGHCATCNDCGFISPYRTHITGKYRTATKKQALEMWRWLQGAVGLWAAHQPTQFHDGKSVQTFTTDTKPEVTWL